MNNKLNYILGLLRLSIGWIFLWAFFDKLFGLGFETVSEKAWLAGGSPTFGFLKFATKGPFVGFYQSLAGNPIIDWLFMFGLIFIGLTLILGVVVRLGSYAGILMLILMYTAGSILPIHNPFIDEHIIYIFLMLSFIFSDAGNYFGIGKRWGKTALVKKYQILK